jgi:hypothetical protein
MLDVDEKQSKIACCKIEGLKSRRTGLILAARR